MKSVQTIVEEERDERTISSNLEGACNELPGLIQVPCKMLIQSLVRNLMDKFDPDLVCTNLGFCSEEDLREERDLTVRAVNRTINCTACEFTVRSLQTTAEERKSRGFKLSIKDICDSLSGLARTVCKGVDALINSKNHRRDFTTMPPRELCRGIQMCDNPPIARSVPSPISLVSIALPSVRLPVFPLMKSPGMLLWLG